MKSHTLTLLLLIMAICTHSVFAQQESPRFSLEIAGGPSYSNRSLAGADLNIGGGFEAVFHYRVLSHTGVYAGWGWNKFSADQSFAGKNMDFEETGYVFGLQFKHPISSGSIQAFVRAGGLYNHIEIENTDGDITDDTGHGLGFQLAGGLEIPVAKKWSITPGIKFNYLSRDLDSQSTSRELNLSYDCLRIGIERKF